MSKKFNSTYELLYYFCLKGQVKIQFSQKHSTELYPDFYFGDKVLQEELFTPIPLWFFGGDGTLPWSDVTISFFKNEDDELEFELLESRVDKEYFPDWDEDYDDYLLDVNELKDGETYIINKG